jgi:hypothetical protein
MLLKICIDCCTLPTKKHHQGFAADSNRGLLLEAIHTHRSCRPHLQPEQPAAASASANTSSCQGRSCHPRLQPEHPAACECPPLEPSSSSCQGLRVYNRTGCSTASSKHRTCVSKPIRQQCRAAAALFCSTVQASTSICSCTASTMHPSKQ